MNLAMLHLVKRNLVGKRQTKRTAERAGAASAGPGQYAWSSNWSAEQAGCWVDSGTCSEGLPCAVLLMQSRYSVLESSYMYCLEARVSRSESPKCSWVLPADRHISDISPHRTEYENETPCLYTLYKGHTCRVRLSMRHRLRCVEEIMKMDHEAQILLAQNKNIGNKKCDGHEMLVISA